MGSQWKSSNREWHERNWCLGKSPPVINLGKIRRKEECWPGSSFSVQAKWMRAQRGGGRNGMEKTALKNLRQEDGRGAADVCLIERLEKTLRRNQRCACGSSGPHWGMREVRQHCALRGLTILSDLIRAPRVQEATWLIDLYPALSKRSLRWFYTWLSSGLYFPNKVVYTFQIIIVMIIIPKN